MAIMLRCSLYFSIMFVIGSTLVSTDAGQLLSDVKFRFTKTSAKKKLNVSTTF